MNKYIEGVGEVSVPTGAKERLTNFWYHYKWHSIVAVILIFTILICTLQLCQKQEYDMHIMYAGGYVVNKTASEGSEADIVKVISSLKKVADDFDGDGSVSVNFTNYFYMSTEEIEATGTSVDYSFLSTDKKALEGALEYSEYYLCFISPAVYEAYNERGEIDMFMSLDEFRSIAADDAFYSENAIKLSSTDFYKLPGIKTMPADTLICIKTPSILTSKSKEHAEYVSRAREAMRNILSLKQNTLD